MHINALPTPIDCDARNVPRKADRRSQITALTDEVTLRHGTVLTNRIVMAPMVTLSGTHNGEVSDDLLHYFARRSKVASMIIVEATAVSPTGLTFTNQLQLSNDRYIAGMKKLASTIKKDGARAIVQLHHGGREAGVYYDLGGIPEAPSDLDYQHNPHSSIDYPVREMTIGQIHDVIRDYGEATKRAIKAGFDGVEIHAANHYLLQQFFSLNTNHRTDEYGGDLASRMKFCLEVVNEVLRVARLYGPEDFIVGVRISPNEIHGSHYGFGYKENQALIEQLNKTDIDYVHISGITASSTSFRNRPEGMTKTYTQLYKDVIDPNIKLITCGGVLSAADAQEAGQQADLVAIAREALMEPDFAEKLKTGHADDIVTQISPERLKDVAWPKSLEQLYLNGSYGDPRGHGVFTPSPLSNMESLSANRSTTTH